MDIDVRDMWEVPDLTLEDMTIEQCEVESSIY
jgi:hypothetical protein